MIKAVDIISRYAERPYLIEASGPRCLSYSQLAFAASELANWLNTHGVTRGDRVALMMPNGFELACAYFACLYGGITAVPINAKYGEEDREFLLSVSRVKAVLYTEETASLIPSTAECVRLKVTQDEESGAWSIPKVFKEIPDFSVVDYDALFSITFTSGTTGRPKGICHSARTLLTNAAAFNESLSIDQSHRFYHVMPMTYMAGLLNCLLCPFEAGASVVVDREFDARMALDFWSGPIRHSVNCMWISPSVLGLLMQMDRGSDGEAYCNSSMRFIASCTAPLTVELKDDFEKRYNCPVLPSFGLSETLINTIDDPEKRCRPGACGRPIPTVQMRVLGDDGGLAAQGEIGEQMVRSEGQMLGYLNPETGRPDILPREHWFPTGDMGKLDKCGCVHITDRKKDLIIRGGINISPQKIEEVLCKHPLVAEAAVVGLPDPIQGERVVAAIRLETMLSYSKDDFIKCLRKDCERSVEPMAIPECFEIMERFPRSATGKIMKSAIRNLLAGK